MPHQINFARYFRNFFLQVALPQEDDALPADPDGSFEAHERFFSFSNATLQSDEYMRLRDDPETCKPGLELSVRDAFYLSGAGDMSEKLQTRRASCRHPTHQSRRAFSVPLVRW